MPVRPRWRVALLAFALAAAPGVAACGSDTETPPSAPAASAAPSSDAAAPAGGVTTRLRLTGQYTFDGPFTGFMTCYHDASRYFRFEGQQPYFLSIVVSETKDGTFDMPEQDPATGFMAVTDGEPQLDVRGLRKVEGGGDDLAFRNLGGSITFVDEGTSGSLTADWISDDSSARVHSVLEWEGCPAVS